ncbi:MAG: Glucose-methanol-choline oxidoreductase:NAD binding site [Schlesneria sp.]|nr:Glucose-methanol-choline oxidoreductase:NAD binding site [Schlesneria sp.]
MAYAQVPLRNVVDHETASKILYDVVIVGSGVAGAIIANELSRNGFSVLILEAGPGHDFTIPGHEKNLYRFYSAVAKDSNAPYPATPNARMPRDFETKKLVNGAPDTSNSYFVQNGPFPLESTYAKVVGGTTMHWQGSTPRMLPDDFMTESNYGQGRDWPIGYDEIEPYYQMAEREMGVSGDVESQKDLGLRFAGQYVYPMQELPLSYLDKQVSEGLHGAQVSLDGEIYSMSVRTIPQARNGVPNPKYDEGKGYQPVGAVNTHQTSLGERCQGNNNCVPICPVQAKYDARKTLAKALGNNALEKNISSGKRIDLLYQTVASKVWIDPATDRVSRISYKAYGALQSSEHKSGEVRGRIFVIAANAVETPRLMLASGLPSTSGLMGCNLMDHPYLLAWGLMPKPAGTFRGTQSTGGIEELRSGSFRRNQAAFRVDIHNDGWGWATGSPYSDLLDLVDNQNKFSKDLRSGLVDRLSRQLLLAFMVELPAIKSNRVTVDSRYCDALGNERPAITFDLPDYVKAGLAYSRQISRTIFQRLGVEDCTHYDPYGEVGFGYFTFAGQGYLFRGGNHFAGTHLMGHSRNDSVVNSWQRSWDHENLYLVGAGSMCSIGTANTTLTLAALSFRSAEQILKDLTSTSGT